MRAESSTVRTALVSVARFGLAIAIFALAVGQQYTIVAQGPQGMFFCNSAHGISISSRVSTWEWRISRLHPWEISVNAPHSDDGGLFLRSDQQQFVPAFYLPPVPMIQGGWGVTEWGSFVGFSMAEWSSFAVVATHRLLILLFVAFNFCLHFVYRKRRGLLSTKC